MNKGKQNVKCQNQNVKIVLKVDALSGSINNFG